MRIADKESKCHDNRVVVKFQENAWCDKGIMLFWVKNMWNAGNMFTSEKRLRLLVYDEHRGQTTDKVKSAVAHGDTTVVMVPQEPLVKFNLWMLQ